MMNLKGNVREITGIIKQKFASLTDDLVLYVNGREEEYLGKIQKNLGKSIAKVSKSLSSEKIN